ncbi:hypothetical protein ABT272_01735 [Streptomyces sp900105245]|uniref:Uncharacterized protein n=1 Tax=Streptomyces sp. 900105245 TaxID=3154379 RepID=A0ABV1TYA8_9ACTN
MPTVVLGRPDPEWTLFPPPVGRRLVHQVYEMADPDVLAGLYGARTIAFKAGTEITAVDRALGLFAAVRARTGRPCAARRWTPLVRAQSWLVGRLGDEAGGFTVSVSGRRDGRAVTRRMGMTARRDGGRIPLAARRHRRRPPADRPAAHARPRPAPLLAHRTRMRTALRDRGSGLWRRDDDAGDWRPWKG